MRKGMLGSRRNRTLLSLIVTVIIVAILLFPIGAAAITVSVEGLKDQQIGQGESFPFNITTTIESGERVPISKVRVTIELPNGTSRAYEFPVMGGEQPYLKLEEPQTIIDTSVHGYGYQYGPGYFYGYGYGYFPFGYGYGYYPTVYGYGFFGPQKLSWNSTLINTGNLPTGNYMLRVEVLSDGVWWGGAPTETSFSIVAVAPSVIGYSPTGTAVPITTAISVTFSESMNKTSVEEAFSISPSVSGSFSWTDNTVVFTPDAALGYSVEYTVTISTVAEDVAGRNLESPFSWQFTTEPMVIPPPPPPPPPVDRPDLTPTSIEVTPPELTVEETCVVNATVENIGTADSGSFDVRFEANETVIKTLPVGGLAVDENTTLGFSWTPSEPGTYSLTATVDPGDLVTELNETNNQISAMVTVEPKPPPLLPDLTVEFVDLPAAFVADTEYEINVLVTNIGEEAAETFNVELKANGASVGKIGVEGLAVGASTTLSFSWTPSEPGTYSLTATVDPEDVVDESDETNNVVSSAVTVEPKPLPDLTVEFVDLPAAFVADTEYEINVLVTNIGEGEAEPFNVELRANEVSRELKLVEDLEAGASTTLTYTWTPEEARSYTLEAIADPEDVVTELDETNNSATASVTVAAIPPPPIEWWPIITGIMVVVIIAIIAGFMVRRARS